MVKLFGNLILVLGLGLAVAILMMLFPDSGYRPGEELTFYYSDWYAPGVGLVLTRQWDDAKHERERTRIELMAYSVTMADGAAVKN